MSDEPQLFPLVQTVAWRKLGVTKTERWDGSIRNDDWEASELAETRSPASPPSEGSGRKAAGGWASAPCQCSADKLPDDGALWCIYLPARALSADHLMRWGVIVPISSRCVWTVCRGTFQVEPFQSSHIPSLYWPQSGMECWQQWMVFSHLSVFFFSIPGRVWLCCELSEERPQHPHCLHTLHVHLCCDRCAAL